MYRKFFDLEQRPFEITADPSLLFLTSDVREALAGLTYAIIERRGLSVLASDPGIGKTTLLTTVRQRVPEDNAQIACILNPVLNSREFLETVLMEFGHGHVPSTKPQRLQQLIRKLTKNFEDGRSSALLIDDADQLTPGALDEVRLLSNLEAGGQKLLQIILFGKRELEHILDRPEMRQFKQRISLWLAIRPLTFLEVRQYIAHRWKHSGGKSPSPFDPAALERVFDISQGIPRVINSLCEASLMLAFAEGVHVITTSHIAEASNDLRLVSKPDQAILESARSGTLAAQEAVTLATRNGLQNPSTNRDRFSWLRQLKRLGRREALPEH